MVKSCCAVGCSNVYRNGSGIEFYRFPNDPERKAKWIAVVKRENWAPSEHTLICSQHFVTGEKNNNPLVLNYVPSLFKHVDSPTKRRLEVDMEKFHRRQAMKKRAMERSVSVCSTTMNEDNENEFTANTNNQTVDNGEETNLLPLTNDETQTVSGKDEVHVLPIRNEHDIELECETSGQVINPPTEEYERKLLETPEQLSCVQDLLLFTTEKLAKTTDQLSCVKSELLTANSQLAETKELLVEAKLELSSMQKKCAS